MMDNLHLEQSCAPVLISVYNRDWHFKQTIESLKNCELANQTDVYIAIDAPSRKEDVKRNQLIRDYSLRIEGFKKVIPIIRDINIGPVKNINKARDLIFQKSNKLIFSEDDNVFSTKYLKYMNDALCKYENEKKIFSVSGWSHPTKKTKENLYIWKGYSAWGVGLWRDKWQKCVWDICKVDKWLESNMHKKKLNEVASHYVNALELMRNKRIINGDGYISSYCVENDLFSIYPSMPMARNIGHDGSGNTKMYAPKYDRQEIDNHYDYVLPEKLEECEIMNRILKNHFSISSRIKDRLLAKYYKLLIILQNNKIE